MRAGELQDWDDWDDQPSPIDVQEGDEEGSFVESPRHTPAGRAFYLETSTDGHRMVGRSLVNKLVSR